MHSHGFLRKVFLTPGHVLQKKKLKLCTKKKDTNFCIVAIGIVSTEKVDLIKYIYF